MKSSTENWPVVGVKDIGEASTYYSNIFNFNKVAGETTGELKFYDLKLFLKQSDAIGPVILNDDKVHYANKKKYDSITYKGILNLPVPDIKEYYSKILDKDIFFIQKLDMLDYDLEGFSVLDKFDNVLSFFTDYHGPYSPDLWKWEILKIA